MPPGSKKRKASKKPKPGEPQGGPSELETGLEDSMGKDGEETVEGSPSPKKTDLASESVAVVGVEEGKELIREGSQEEGELVEAEEASAPDHPVELEPEVPTISAAEVPNGNGVGGEDPVDIKRGDPLPQIREEIEIPLGEMEPKIEAPPAENKPEVEADAGSTGLERDIDSLGVPPIGIALADADDTEPRESAPYEMEAEPREAPVEVEWMADVAQEDTGPENDTTAPDIIEVGFERGVDEEAAEMDAAPRNAQPENDEDTVGRDLDTHAASSNFQPHDTPVETEEDLVSDQPEIDEAVVEMQLQAGAVAGNFEMDHWMDAAPVDAEPEIDENLVVREVDADTPSAIIEPAVTDDALSETAAETDKDPPDVQSELEEVMEQRQPETDAVPSNLEPEPTAESETTQVGEDASAGEEVEPASPRIESQKDLSEGEIEANMDVASVDVEEAEPEATMREVGSETELSLGEIKPEVDATLDDTTKDEVSEGETQPEERASLDYSNYDEGAQADIEPEPEESAFIEVGPEVEVDIDYSSLETAADALKDIVLEAERVTGASDEIEGPTTPEVEEMLENSEPANEILTEVTGSEKDLNQGVETPLEAATQPAEGTIQEVELSDKAEPADEALMEASVSGSKEDFTQGVEAPSEADTEPEGGTATEYKPEAEGKIDVDADAEVLEPEPEVKVPSELKLDQEGPFETELNQPDLTGIELDQSNVEDNDQQIQQQEREVDLGVEAPEVPGGEADQEELSATDAGLGDGSVSSLLDGDALANAGTDMPTIEQEKPEEGEVISLPEEGLNDEGADEEQGAVLAQLDEQERADVNDFFGDQEEAETEEFQPTLDEEQELTRDPSAIDVPPDDSEMAKQGLSSTLPPESEVTANEYDPKDGVAVQNFDSSSGDVERDVGDEDAALSTVAEAGSVINDLDERASYQQLPMEFPFSEQDADISEGTASDNTISLRTPELQVDNHGWEFVDTQSPRAPELLGRGLTDQVGGGGEHADSSREDDSKVLGDSPQDEVEWKAAQDFERIGVHEAVSPIQDKEITIVEAGGGGEKNGQRAVLPTFGIVPALDYLTATEKELMPKVLPSDSDGLRSLPSTEPPVYDQVNPVEETFVQDNGVVNSEEAEIRAAEAKDLKAAAATPGKVLEKTAFNGDPLLSASQEKDKQAFRQQNTQAASLPVILPPQDVKQRALAQGGSKGDEHGRGGGTLQRRTNWLGCCGMFDLLVGKNQ